jgi:hypothetical protein
MTLIYTRQAKSFLSPDDGLYKRPPVSQLIPYMVRMSGAIRSAPIAHRSAAVNMASAGMLEALAKVHRGLRPYFFRPIDDVIAGYGATPIELPDLAELPQIHNAMHFCFEALVDFDRLVMLLQSEPEQEVVGDEVFALWSAMSRVANRSQGIEGRIKSGKAFKGGS